MGLAGIKVSNILAKTVGIAALTTIGYDAHMNAKSEAPEAEKRHKAESITDNYIEQSKLDSPSVVKSALKKRLFEFNLDENISSFFTTPVGYVKGFTNILIDNVVPLTLALGTLTGKRGGKNIISKFSALGLVAYGGMFVLQEGFGIGRSHK